MVSALDWGSRGRRFESGRPDERITLPYPYPVPQQQCKLPARRTPTMAREAEVGPASEFTPRTVKGAGRYAVGNAGGEFFAVTRRCRHLFADLAGGRIDKNGCLVCPVARLKVRRAHRKDGPGPAGIFAKIPGLVAAYKALTRVLPLGRGEVVERDGILHVR